MPNDDRTLPPGSGRVAAATRHGLFARSEVLMAGIVLLACSGTMAIVGMDLHQGIKSLMRDGILGAVTGHPDPVVALKETIAKGLLLLAPILFATLVAGSISSLLPAILSRKTKGRTAIPLPTVPKINFPSSVLKITGMILVVLVSLLVMRSHVGSLAVSMEGSVSSTSDLFNGLLGLMAAGGVVMVLVGLSEQAINRHTTWRLLHLSRSETRREQRVTGGDRATKSASLRRHRKEAAK